MMTFHVRVLYALHLALGTLVTLELSLKYFLHTWNETSSNAFTTCSRLIEHIQVTKGKIAKRGSSSEGKY